MRGVGKAKRTPDFIILLKTFSALIIVLELGEELAIQKTPKFCCFSVELKCLRAIFVNYVVREDTHR